MFFYVFFGQKVRKKSVKGRSIPAELSPSSPPALWLSSVHPHSVHHDPGPPSTEKMKYLRYQSRSSRSPKTWSSPRNMEFTMELQVCAILSHTHRCFVPFAPPPLLSSEPTFSVLKNLKVLKTCMFDYKKEEIIHRGMQT